MVSQLSQIEIIYSESDGKPIYEVEVSPTLISNVTDVVIDKVKQWQNRP
jgi:hypothetical protein